MSDLRSILRDVMGALPSAHSEQLAGHPLQTLVTKSGPEVVRSLLPPAGYAVEGSVGKGNWSRTPWIATFDLLVTDSAQRGYYVVYLFRGDGTAAFLSLNQGTTAVREEIGRGYLNVLEDTGAYYADLLRPTSIVDLTTGPLDLGEAGKLTAGYEAANIVAVEYERETVPANEELESDLRRLIGLYQRLVEVADAVGDETLGELGPAGAASASGIEARGTRWHRRVERNQRLVADAKQIHGTTCQACGFEFEERYGEIGRGFIEAHHRTPVSSLNGRPTELDPADDFAVLCSNCHRMIHRRQPPLEVDELRALLDVENS